MSTLRHCSLSIKYD